MAIVRQALGCRQDQMADYLDVSRALLSNVEIGNRSLPSQANLKLLDLYQLIQQNPAGEITEEAISAAGSKIGRYVFKMNQQVIQQRKRCEALATNRTVTLAALRNIEWLLQHTNAENEALILLLKMLQAEAKVKLHNFSSEIIAFENLKLKGMEAACVAFTGK